MAERYLEKVILAEDCGFSSWVIRVLLWPLSVIYRIGLWAYLFIYRVGIRKRCKLNVPVISIGNLTFGGTGKTPAVQTLCRMLIENGKKVVVLSRGHGGAAKGVVIASDGEKILSDGAEAGDEPILLARTLPGVPVVVGKDRRESGRLACEKFTPDVIMLDDGLQYWQLNRELDIVILDAKKPFGSGFVMPMGDLREPISGLRRAGIVLLSNAHSIGDAEYKSLAERISKLAPDARIFSCSHEPVCFRNICTGEDVDLAWIKQRRVFAFCGIGKPLSFLDMLDGLGASVNRSIVFPDHYRLMDKDISRIIDEALACKAEVMVTTEKDITRLMSVNNGIACFDKAELFALVIKLEIEDNAGFAQYITNRINK